MKKNKCVIGYLLLTFSFYSIFPHNTSLEKTSDEIPIIFIHLGYGEHLEHSLWQALQYNKNVILISNNKNNKHGLDIQYYDITPFKKEADQFATEYVHLSHVKKDIQLRRIQRWFILKSFMVQHNIPICFHCDSDVMIYSNILNEVKKFEPFDFALVTGKAFLPIPIESKNLLYSSRFSGNTVLIKKEVICDFCLFLHHFYTDKNNINQFIQLHKQKKLPSLVGDMFLITCYMDMTDAPKKFIIKNICDIKDDKVFDSSIIRSFDGQFDMTKSQMRVIKWINNKPYSYNKVLGKMIGFNTLHFSVSKHCMSDYRREKIQ